MPPLKFKKILWSTDFSHPADEAFEWALALAERLGAELLVRHVLVPVEHPLIDEELIEKAKQERAIEINEKLLQYVKRARDKGLRSNSRVLEGRSWEAIVEESQKEGARLIILGVKGAGALESLFTGSTFSRVVQSSSIPVLGIPPNAGTPRFDRILVPTDLTPPSFKALDLAIKISEHTGSTITLFHVVSTGDIDIPPETLTALEERVFKRCSSVLRRKKTKVEVKVEVRFSKEGDIEREIVDFAETSDQSMIFMNSHTRKGILKWLWGNITEKVLRHTFVPVCVVKT